jgi:hypothetical protein
MTESRRGDRTEWKNLRNICRRRCRCEQSILARDGVFVENGEKQGADLEISNEQLRSVRNVDKNGKRVAIKYVPFLPQNPLKVESHVR